MQSTRITMILATRRSLAVLAALALLAGCAGATIGARNIGKTRMTSLGEVLVDGSGNTLYTYDPDPRGASRCTGMCSVIWPPAEADAEARPNGEFTIVTRGSGTRQWAYKGKPLYGYAFDNGPGSVSGEGADGEWHVAKP